MWRKHRKAEPDIGKLLGEDGTGAPMSPEDVTITAMGKVELTGEEGENTVQNRGENTTYYLA